MDVGTWLQGLGLGRYEQAFHDAAIDAKVLPDVTDEHLRELGIPLGHRIQLAKAIAALGEQGPANEPARTPPPSSEAERRQLTVLFCDLVGSTALSSQLDPEDMREVIRCYQVACAGVIARFEGFVAKFMGDGVLAYFGYPRAHEDEAERAVRAGLALVEAVAGLHAPGLALGGGRKQGERLAARIGIATGQVVVGDLVGEGAAQERAVVGDTPNLAARLQGVALPGQVVIAAATRRLIGAGFDLADLGPQALKGLAEPVTAFAVVGEQTLQSRFEAHRQVLPMVGRDQELALLLERWGQAKAGEGQAVLLVGEAGIGKSRITRALLDALAEEPHSRIRYQCSPYHTDSALWPVIQQLGRATGIARDDPVEAKLDKLEALLEQAGDAAAAPLIADLLGLDDARYGALELTPQAQRARTLEALTQQLLGLAAQQPVLVLLEDAHWIDPTTLELIEQCLDCIAGDRVLTLLTTRPDHQPNLAAHPHMTRLSLNRLGHAGAKAIIARLGGERLPGDTVDAIVARTDGVPLFVEELTKTILETGETTIPTSLQDLLMARLDRIPEVKEVAQIAACIGREFTYPLLAAVVDRSGADLHAALDRLTEAELVFCRGRPPDATYTFKHALVRDAAYASCLNARKRELHAKVAATLEASQTGAAPSEPATLAYHYGEAGFVDEAVSSWLLAAQRAVAASANKEAIQCVEQGARLLEAMVDPDRRDFLELELLATFGAPMIAEKGQASPEVEKVYSRGLNLARQRGDRERLVTLLQGLGRVYLMRPDLAKLEGVAEELEKAVDHSEMPALCRLRAQHAYWAGSFNVSHRFATRGVQLSDFDREQRQAVSHGMDHGLVCMTYRASSLAMLGYPTGAIAETKEAIDRAEQVAHPYSLAHNLGQTALLQETIRDVSGASRTAQLLLDLASRYGLQQWTILAEFGLGWVGSYEDDLAHGVARMTAARSSYKEKIGAHAWPLHTGLLVESLIRLGDFDRAGREVAGALVIATRSGTNCWTAELHRLKAQLRLRDRSDPMAASDSLQRAVEIAREQQAKILELRAVRDLSQLWAEGGDRRRAHDLLAPVYAWFTEGFDTPDLIEAKSLLDELA